MSTLLDWRALLALAAALFLAGYAAGTCGKPTTRELELARDSTEAAVERAQDAEERRAEVEEQARRDSIAFARTADSALAVADAAERRRPTVIDRIVNREAPADTALARRVAVAVTDSIVSYEVNPLRAALAAAEGAYISQGALLVAERETRIAAQQALERALAEIGALRDERPSWVARHWKDAAIVGGIVLGWKAHEIWTAR